MDKSQLRLKMWEKLLDIDAEQRDMKSGNACRNLISTPQFQKAVTIMVFLSTLHEVDTSEVMFCAWQLGKIVSVPKVYWQKRSMAAVRIDSLEAEFSTEVAGLRNPVNGAPMPLEQIDMVIVPGMAFDGVGNRLGRGGSYYDRFFCNKKLDASRCGFAFEEQLVESVPVSGHDKPMDFLVTDENIVYF